VGLQLGEGEAVTAAALGAADGELDTVLLEPPQAASASSATKSSRSSTPAAFARDPRLP